MLLGADSPKTTWPADAHNEAGYWEPKGIIQLHDQLFASASSSWDDLSQFPSSWYEAPSADLFRKRALSLIETEYGDSSLFVLKDPRISMTVPFWLSVFDDLEVEPLFVISVRNPIEVAASLEKRDGFATGRGTLLWLRHMLEAERQTRGRPRVLVSYDSVMRSWESVAMDVSRRLGVHWPRLTHRTRAEIGSFVSDQLRHHEFTSKDLDRRPEISNWVKSAYLLFDAASATQSEPDPRALNKIGRQLNDADLAYGPMLAAAELEAEESQDEFERVSAELVERKRELEAATAAHADAARQVQQLSARLGEEHGDAVAPTSRPGPTDGVNGGSADEVARTLAHAAAGHDAVRRMLEEIDPTPLTPEP